MKRKSFIYTFALGSGSLLFHGLRLNAANHRAGFTTIKMIYNNTGKCPGLENDWGLSAWIENEHTVTLFDTGADALTLRKNMKYLDLDPRNIDQIVISHKHRDHFGGLGFILDKVKDKTNLFVVAQDHKEFQSDYPSAKVIAVRNPTRIQQNIWSTGSLCTSESAYDIHEQSLIIIANDAMVIMNGCSHPGILKIVKQAKANHPDKRIALVAGGFHLMRKPEEEVKKISAELKELGIEKIAPSHCTGVNAIEIFREDWGDQFVDLNIGDELQC